MQWNNEQFFNRSARGRCKGFSFGSRRRMLNRLNEVSTAARLPYFVTATLPDESFDDDAARFAKTAKVWMDNFTKRLLRVSPGACGFWRVEWKGRKSGLHEGKLFPHFHLLVWGLLEREIDPTWIGDPDTGNVIEERANFESYIDLPDSQLTLALVQVLAGSKRAEGDGVHVTKTGDGAGVEWEFSGRPRYIDRCCELVVSLSVEKKHPEHPLAVKARKMAFADWASLAWYRVVDSHNTDHLKAGLRVSRVRTWGGVMSYCAKYMAKADCEFLSDVAFGRSWGVFNRKCVPWAKMIEIDLPGEVGIRLRRVARHYLDRVCRRKRPRPYGLTLYCNVAQWMKLWEKPPDTPF
jgi:hypothetical protein